MTADTLLASSMRLSDNTMMIGGKDIRTYGIDANSGKVMINLYIQESIFYMVF